VSILFSGIEPSDHFDGAVVVQIFVLALREPHEALRSTTRLLARHPRGHGQKGADDRFKIVAVGPSPTE
jgi:hypothetical protein